MSYTVTLTVGTYVPYSKVVRNFDNREDAVRFLNECLENPEYDDISFFTLRKNEERGPIDANGRQ